jgi:hypothetical protein
MRLFAFFVLVVFGSGCSTLGDTTSAGGGAAYTLKRNGDQCEIAVNSSRDVAGASVSVDGADCSMTADVGKMEGITVTPELLQMLLGR